MNKLLAALIMLLSGNAFAAPIQPATVQSLKDLRTHTRTWAYTCPDGTITPYIQAACPYGDMNEYAGLLCLSGETDRCNDVKNSQGPDGRWYRNPKSVGVGNGQNSFSRDGMTGTLAYLVATKDTAAAQRWLNYIVPHNDQMCDDGEKGTCKVMTTAWAHFADVWTYLGLPLTGKMKVNRVVDHIYSPLEAIFQKFDIELSLADETAYVRTAIADRTGTDVRAFSKSIARTLAKRDPGNAFFIFMRDGATEEAAQMVLTECPYDPLTSTDPRNWLWDVSEENDVRRGTGWDCIFMVNLLIGPENAAQ